MKISRIKISNVLGVDDLEFEAGRFNEVTGQNGTGKTSFIEALKSVIQGGVDATLLRRGAEKGEVVLVIDDGTEIRKRLSASGTQVTTVTRDGKRVAPAETIKKMTDMLSVNPVEFLRVPKKQRLSALLDSLPIHADIDRLSALVGRPIKMAGGQHALELIQAVYQQVFDDRTGTNRAVREKHATINQLSGTLPPGAEIAPTGDLSALLAELAEIDGAKDAELIRITGKLDGLRLESEGKRQAVREAANAVIADLREQIEALRGKITAETAKMEAGVAAEVAAFTSIENLAAQQRERALSAHTLQRSTVAASVARVQSEQSQNSRNAQTRETVAAMRADAEALEADAARQTAALAALEDYKSELLKVLPIDGLSVVEGEIFRNGIPFDRLNTEQQVTIAVEIAKLRAGDLGFICVDGLEALDGKHFDAFRKASLESDLQFFVTRVTDGEFSVSAEF